MLTDGLKSIYQRYKHDTSVVASWLASTGKKHGWVEPTNAKRVNNGSAKGRSKLKSTSKHRSKNKVRQRAPQAANPLDIIAAADKAEKEAKAVAAGTMTTSTKPEYILPIRHFESLASHIADHAKSDKIEVPLYVAETLERVIWSRKSFSHALRDLDSQSFDDGGGHSHFLECLERCRDCLQPYFEAAPGPIKVAGCSSSGATSIFSSLKVYEPSEEFLNAPDVQMPSASELAIDYAAEQDESPNEAWFAFISMLADFAEIRSVIDDLWNGYLAGEKDLAAVAVASNAAIELARSLEQDVAPMITKQRSSVRDFHTQLMDWQSEHDELVHPMHELGHDLWNNVCKVLELFVEAQILTGSKKYSLTTYSGTFGWYEEQSALNPKTTDPRRQQHQDRLALAELLPDLQFLAGRTAKVPVADELLRGLFATYDDAKHQCPIWAGLAGQVYLDNLARIPLGKAWEELQLVNRAAHHAVHPIPAHTPEDKLEKDTIINDATFWDGDCLALFRQYVGHHVPKPHTFVRRNSLYCGLYIHHMRTLLHTRGINYAASSATLVHTGQLYQALRQEKLLGQKWDDLEAFMSMQGPKPFFVGNSPKDFQGYFKNYCLCMGMSMTNWAPEQRSTKAARNGRFQMPKISQATRRNLKSKGQVSLSLSKRFSTRNLNSRAPLDVDFITKVLAHAEAGAEANAEETSELVEENRKIGEAAPTVPLPKLIRQLCDIVDREIPLLEFDYFGMHENCWDVLVHMKHAFQDICPIAITVLPSEECLPWLVGFVFSTAAGRQGINLPPSAPKTQLLKSAAGVVGAYLAEGKGTKIGDQLRRAKGGLVEQLEAPEGTDANMARLVREEIAKHRSGDAPGDEQG